MARFPPEQLHGAALVLRRPKPDEFLPVLSIFRDDPAATRFVAWQPKTTEQAARRFLEVLLRGWEHRRPTWWMTHVGDGAVVGSIIPAMDGEEVEINYTVQREAWGRGHANTASARVLEKAGFRLDAHLPHHGVHNVSPESRDCVRYVRDRDGATPCSG